MAAKDIKIRKIIAWFSGIVFALIIVIPCLLYIPVIQDGVKNLATSYVNDNTSMKMSIERIRLKFPFLLNVDNTLILDENQDTMVYVGDLLVRVKLMPLFKQKVEIQDVELNRCVYNMKSEDASMILNAHVNHFKLENSLVLLDKNEVNLGNIALNGGDVSMILDSTKQTTAVPEDTTETVAWKINLEKVKMDDISYRMKMLPTIQDLNTNVARAVLNKCSVDLGGSKVGIQYFGIDSVDVKYLYPTAEYLAEHPTEADSTVVETASAGAVWTINADALRLNDSHVLYAMSGATPIDGLDMNYIELNDINVAIDSLYNRGADIKLDLSKLTARERCGLFVTSGKGRISMDDVAMVANGVKIETMQSKIMLDGEVGMNFATDNTAPMVMDMKVALGLGELGYMYPDMKPLLREIPQNNPIEMVVNVEGTAGELNLKEALINMPQHIAVNAMGKITNMMNPDKLAANVDFSGDFKNLSFVKPIVMADSTTRSEVNFPEMKLSGAVAYLPNMANGDVALHLQNGAIALKGEWDRNTDSYNAALRVDSFPVNDIMPLLQVGGVSARASVKGQGYIPFDPKTLMDANVVIDDLEYDNKTYRDISLAAQMENGYLSMDVDSKNVDCNMDVTLSCMLNDDYYEFGAEGNVKNLDLKSMRLSDVTSKGKGRIVVYGTANMENNAYVADLNLRDFEWTLDKDKYSTPAVVTSVVSNRDSMSLYAYEEDLFVNFNTPVGLDTLLSRFTKCQEIVDYEIQKKYLDVDTLQRTLPPMVCELRIGKRNLVQQALQSYGIKMKNIGLDLINDSTIYMNGAIVGFESGELKLDTISLYANQRNKYLTYNMHVGNRPGTNDEFAKVTVKGGIFGSNLGMLLEQQNILGEQGFRIGVNAHLSDTTVNVNVFPKEPIIGYRKWNVNDGNIVSFNYVNRAFDADLSLRSDSSVVALHTEQNRRKPELRDIILNVGGVQISEWLKVSPFIPPMSGVFSADMKMNFDGKNILGGGITRLKDFKYNRKRVGDFDLKVALELDPVKNFIKLISSFDVDGKRAIVARGSLNDTTSNNPYNITVNVDSFPLRVANPFIPGDMAKMDGVLNGSMNVLGTFADPLINGYMQCNGGEINMPLFGSRLTLSDTKIPVDSSLIKFNSFKIYGSNKNAIDINGYVDMLPMDNPKIDLRLRGNNIEFVNSKQQRKMEVFGKGYANINTDVKGSLNDMNVNVDLSILPATNLTYVMQTDVSALATQTDENMVKFVNFADTAEVETDSLDTHISTSSFKLNAKLNIQQGSKFNVYLSNSGNDRVAIEGSGILNYSQSSLGDMRLVGQYVLSSGYVKYTPPLLSEKLFEFTDGSYVSWTGDVLNPVLNIKAIDTMKASVSQEGQDSRLINFLVSLSVTNTLNNMNLEFDLSTNDDVTVQNELLSMSPSQRSSQAINLLLYNTYTGQGTTASTANNPLYSFLNSQINRWAANTIKGVDLTLGVNQYDGTKGDATSKSTSYSYKISKSLFNDRFKIVVGGNYNPGGDTEDNFANSLLNDISFVYMLNQSGTMSVKLFRHTGFESILEGEVTETGGAFVIKRKLSTLRNFFRFGRKKRNTSVEEVPRDTIIKLEETPVRQNTK